MAGIEADINWSGLRNSDTVAQPLLPPTFAPGGTFAHTVTTSLDWFGTVRGCVGFLATPNLLLYGTGGLAYGQVRSSSISVFTPPGSLDNYAGNVPDTRFGWTAGAGGEWLLGNNWSIKAEYLYIDLGNLTYANPCVSPAAICAIVPPPAYQTTVTTRDHVARVGINYHFGSPVVAKY